MIKIRTFLSCAICSLFSFQLGTLIGSNRVCNCNTNNHGYNSQQAPPWKQQQQNQSPFSSSTTKSSSSIKDDNNNIDFFPDSISNLFYGASRIKRDDFIKEYGYTLGVPYDKRRKGGNDDILLLYSDANAMPTTTNKVLSAKDATSNCHVMKIVLTDPYEQNHCMAIVGQWESYHIYKYMRLPSDSLGRNGIDPTLPLRHVARTHNERMGKAQVIPRHYNVKIYEKLIFNYFMNLEDVYKKKLKPIIKGLKGDGGGYIPEKRRGKKNDVKRDFDKSYSINNTVIVLTCNYGQSQLLLNFLCNCRSKGFDTSRIIVFPTDVKTKELVDSFVDVATYYDEDLFNDMPSDAAARYGDGRFKGMMMAKVFVVHMVLSLGYDVLFQDVDVVWFRHPLTEFFAKEIPKDETELSKLNYNGSDGNVYDLYFQDDGSRTPRYAPFSANTGFYYVRYSERTLYFFTQLLRQGDTIIQSGSHQGALTAVMNEFVMYRGLRVKTYSAHTTDYFPGGFQYHQSGRTGSHNFMKQLFRRMKFNDGDKNVPGNKDNLINPYIFHMSWTENFINKKKFFQQMGLWYVHDQCTNITDTIQNIPQNCCVIQPKVVCHYRDKPSKESCSTSEAIDKGHPSWW